MVLKITMFFKCMFSFVFIGIQQVIITYKVERDMVPKNEGPGNNSYCGKYFRTQHNCI